MKRHLDAPGLLIPEQEVIEVREKTFGELYSDRTLHPATYMMSEHFAAHLCTRLLERAQRAGAGD